MPPSTIRVQYGVRPPACPGLPIQGADRPRHGAAADPVSPDDQPLPAGSFSAWLTGIERALEGEAPSDVPCGTCTACCTSSLFVHIGPDEADTLARVPAQLLFPAPRMPRGNVLMGYDQNGHCPMLVDGGCSIYRHRPRTCRTYDCRIFPAAGLEPDSDKVSIARQARRWRFDVADESSQVEHDAVRAAARWVREHRDQLPDGTVPANATHHAVLAVRVHAAFLRHEGGTARPAVVDPAPGAVEALLRGQSDGPGPTG